MNQPYRTFHALLIPEATNREPIGLIEVVPVNIADVVVQVAVPGVRRKVLHRTPPEATAANAAECSIGVTKATRKTCKSTAICSACIGA